MKILHVVGARPNFMKTAPIMAEMSHYPDHFQQVLVHTGQHYDDNMSKIFLEDLEMPSPDKYLNVGSGTHTEQTARIMVAFEPVVLRYRPDWVMVVGDVNSTLACALVCAKIGVKIAHIEAGLRSRDHSMPEEINRLLTDHIADLLFTPSKDASANLLREGISPSRIHFVGNVMIDTLIKMLPKALNRKIVATMGLKYKKYVLVTLHRPSNVDDPDTLKEIFEALKRISKLMPVIFPVHPRTRQNVEGLKLLSLNSRVKLTQPLGYLDFLALMHSARLVLTDSGGIQEETTYLGVPCLTVRPSTERPITIEAGTNRLVASKGVEIIGAIQDIMTRCKKNTSRPELWDGLAAKRIIQIMMAL